MLNLEVARKAVMELRPSAFFSTPEDEKNGEACAILDSFIDDVEKLITYNSIKQVPSLLSPKKGQ